MRMREPVPYVGRFAPSPTGPLHFGSLVAAVASYLQARVNHGRWLLRIEDIDPPREQAGATEQIIEALALYGFEWDGDTLFQSSSQKAQYCQRVDNKPLLGQGLQIVLRDPCAQSKPHKWQHTGITKPLHHSAAVHLSSPADVAQSLTESPPRQIRT